MNIIFLYIDLRTIGYILTLPKLKLFGNIFDSNIILGGQFLLNNDLWFDMFSASWYTNNTIYFQVAGVNTRDSLGTEYWSEY